MFDYNYIIASYSQGREFSSKWYRFKKKFWTILRFADSVIKCYIYFFKSEKKIIYRYHEQVKPKIQSIFITYFKLNMYLSNVQLLQSLIQLYTLPKYIKSINKIRLTSICILSIKVYVKELKRDKLCCRYSTVSQSRYNTNGHLCLYQISSKHIYIH